MSDINVLSFLNKIIMKPRTETPSNHDIRSIGLPSKMMAKQGSCFLKL